MPYATGICTRLPCSCADWRHTAQSRVDIACYCALETRARTNWIAGWFQTIILIHRMHQFAHNLTAYFLTFGLHEVIGILRCHSKQAYKITVLSGVTCILYILTMLRSVVAICDALMSIQDTTRGVRLTRCPHAEQKSGWRYAHTAHTAKDAIRATAVRTETKFKKLSSIFKLWVEWM